MGQIKDFITNNSGKVEIVLVKFDNAEVGKQAISQSPLKRQYPNCVPVERHSGQYEKAGKKSY